MDPVTIIHQPPVATIFNTGARRRRQPRWLVIAVLPLLVVLIGWVDFITGWEWSLSVAYLLPILLATWWEGRTAGLVMAAFSTVIWWAANESMNPYHTRIGFAAAWLTRLVYFIVAAIGGAAIRNKQASDAAYIGMLEEQRQLEHDIVAVSEHEQQRIGRDLHDGLCQQLAAIGCAAKSLADDLRARRLAEALDAEHIEESIQNAVLEARGLARGIFPVHVDRSGLSTGLVELARATSRLTGVRIEVAECADVQLDNPEVAMHLYRIAQEAVANAVRHSGAHEVVLSVKVQDAQLELRVEDNGRGIDPARDAANAGMGLRTMRYRAKALGARLDIAPRTGGGTTVCCVLGAGTRTFSGNHGTV